MKIFVQRLAPSTTNEVVRKAFEEFGKVDSVKIEYDPETARSRGLCFIEMPNDAEAKDAIYNLDGETIENSEISVKQAESRASKRSPRYYSDDY